MRVFVRVILFNDDDCHNVIFMFLRKKRPECVLQNLYSIEVSTLHLNLKLCLTWHLVLFEICLLSQHLQSVYCVKTYDNFPCSIFIGFEKLFEHLICFKHSSRIQEYTGGKTKHSLCPSSPFGLVEERIIKQIIIIVMGVINIKQRDFIHSEMLGRFLKSTLKLNFEGGEGVCKVKVDGVKIRRKSFRGSLERYLGHYELCKRSDKSLT